MEGRGGGGGGVEKDKRLTTGTVLKGLLSFNLRALRACFVLAELHTGAWCWRTPRHWGDVEAGYKVFSPGESGFF